MENPKDTWATVLEVFKRIHEATGTKQHTDVVLSVRAVVRERDLHVRVRNASAEFLKHHPPCRCKKKEPCSEACAAGRTLLLELEATQK